MSENFLWVVYIVVFGLGGIFPGFSQKIQLCIILFNILVIVINKKSKDIVLLSTFIMGSEVLAILNIIIYCIFNPNKKFHIPKMKNYQFITVIVVLSNSVICSVMYGTGWNLLFEIMYLFILIVTGFVIAADKIDIKRLIYITKRIIVLEFLTSICIIFRTGSFSAGDLNYGTLRNAHYLGNLLIIIILAMLCIECRNIYNFTNFVKKDFWYILMIVLMLYLTDSKALDLSLACAVLLYFIVSVVASEKSRCFIFLISLCMGMLIFVQILYLPEIQRFITRINPVMSVYIYKDGWNAKFSYFNGTFLNLFSGIRLFTGYGLGQYGSRVANAFAYNVMWRDDNFINNFISSIFSPHYVPQFAEYVSIYTEEFVQQIRWRSAVLSYPFSSLIAFIAEYGFAGFGLLSYMASKMLKDSKCKIIIAYFAVACIFDLYFDNFQCTGIVIFYLCNTILKDNIEVINT